MKRLVATARQGQEDLCLGTWGLETGVVYTLGSAPPSDFVVRAKGVSRRHATFCASEESVVFQDQDSKNALITAEGRCREARIEIGEAVQIGESFIRLEELHTLEHLPAVTFTGDGLSVIDGGALGAAEGETEAIELSNERIGRTEFLRRLISARDQGVVEQELAGVPSQIGAEVAMLVEFDTETGPRVISCSGNISGALVEALGETLSRSRTVGERPDNVGVGDRDCLVCWAAHLPRALVAIYGSQEVAVRDEVRDLFGLIADLVLSNPVEELREKSAPELVLPDGMILGQSAAMARFVRRLRAAVTSGLDVLVQGESGTGKELVARAIHLSSGSSGDPWIALNCAAIPAEQLDAELFGVESRVATGVDPRIGRFTQADGGTLLLDEMGELNLELQAKLLRVLQEREVLPLGARSPHKVAVRVISTTNRDLDQDVRAGRFRADLLYRLCGFELQLPPLRDRQEDIPALATALCDKARRRLGRSVRGISMQALSVLVDYRWPGNVRELETVLSRAVANAPLGGTIQSQHLELGSSFLDAGNPQEQQSETAGPGAASHFYGSGTLREAVDATERWCIARALEMEEGNKAAAARRLAISRQGLLDKMRRLGLEVSPERLPSHSSGGEVDEGEVDRRSVLGPGPSGLRT